MQADDLMTLEPRESDWYDLDADRVRAFAEVLGDWQFTHFDAERTRAETPFDDCIVHGFLTLAVLGPMSYEVTRDLEGFDASASYGFDRVRFVSPVRVGGRVRGRFMIANVEEGDGWMNVAWDIEVFAEGQTERPALVANWIIRVFRPSDPEAAADD